MRGPTATAATAVILTGLLAPVAAASTPHSSADSARPTGTSGAPIAGTAADSAQIPPSQRDSTLGKHWRISSDQAWTTSGDANGFHILTAQQRNGYAWKTVATLSEPGVETSQWIGNACVTGSGHYVVVTYAPKEFTNTPEFSDRGAFTAIVNLTSGQVTKLKVNASLAYFDPGCGTGDTAVITQSDNESTTPQTRLQLVNVAKGKVTSTITLDGQITSAVPTGSGIIAADGRHLVHVTSGGKISTVATTNGTAFRLHADGSPGSGNVTFLDTNGKSETIKHLSGSKINTLAGGGLGDFGLSSGTGGRVYITGGPRITGSLPSSVSASTAPAGAQMSFHGDLAVTQAVPKSLADAAKHGIGGVEKDAIESNVGTSAAKTPDGNAEPVVIDATAMVSHKHVTFTTAPQTAGDSSGKPSPLLPYSVGGVSAVQKAAAAQSSGMRTDDLSTDPVDEDRSCSIPRNDPATMVYQPTPNQVEWAADLAVRGLLTSGNISRPDNWKDSGLSAWSPQGMFPLPSLDGGGRIPAQVLLGILAQESNLWQASEHAQPGEYGNPLVGNFYGANIYPGTTGYDPNLIWKIDWSNADCGYGIGQVTDGMRLAGQTKPGETALPANEQRTLAMDYATNIAYAAEILGLKWDELHAPGSTITINNDDSSKIENWFAAVWDYNEGFNAPGSDPSGNWGLGWYNNPANPIYPADRLAFLDNNTYSDAAHPQDWPYEEKVMGWAAWPIDTGRSYDDSGNQNSGNTAGYSAAWWDTGGDRTEVKPPLDAFCNSSNACDVSNPPACETEHIQGCDVLHWYNQSVTWKPDCATTCGNEYMTYQTLRAEPGDAHPAPIPCDEPGAVVVDDIPDSIPQPACPSATWQDGGTFSWSFPVDSDGQYEAKEDLQQISSGFGGHYYFSHGREPNNWDNLLETTGTWTPSSLSNHLYLIQAYMPYLGNKTKTAIYQVTTQSGAVYDRTVDQSSVTNGWVTIGYFNLGSNAKVVLTNVTNDGSSGDTTVAYNALMFSPVQGTWTHHTFDAASIFPSTENLDTNTPWLADSPMRTRQTLYDWAHSVTEGGEKYDNSGTLTGLDNFATCASGTSASTCIGSNLKAASQAWASQVDAAGTSTIADWLAFENPTPPTTIDPNTSFQDDHSYKIKTHIDAQWVTAPDGTIVPGSQYVTYTPRTGDTAIAPFVQNFVSATVSDYGSLGVTMPDLSFTATNPNVYGTSASVANPLTTGTTPGQAYQTAQAAPSIDSSGKCLDTRIVSGGSIGYRMLDAQSTTDQAMSKWLDQLKTLASADELPWEVENAAGDIYSTFFEAPLFSGTDVEAGSLFNEAPPIWQNVSMAFCSDGTVKSTQQALNVDDTPNTGLVYQSYMPDLYLYLDGKMVDQSGNPTSGPVQEGDFASFSNAPTGVDKTAYGPCATGSTGNSGNPWSVSAIGSIGVNDPGAPVYCDTTNQPITGG